MNNPYRDILFDKLKRQGITVLSYCDANDKAVEPLLDNRGVYQAGHMLVHKDNKYGIIYDKGNFQYEVHVPIKYDAVFENEGSKVHDFLDFFNGYDYFCRFAIKITDSLYIFDSYKDNILTTSFIASKFDKDFYYRDGKMYFIQPSSLYKSSIQPFDEIKRITRERNALAQDCYGQDNCYLAVRQGNCWTLYEDSQDIEPRIFLKDFVCDGISMFGSFSLGLYIIINRLSKQSLIIIKNKNIKELNFQVDGIFQIGWCDLENLYSEENCAEASAFILMCDNKFAILHPDGEQMSQFIFDGVLGFINKNTIQVMQNNGSHKLYGEYFLDTGLHTPCMYTAPYKNLQR